jgi:hypothetical protein
MNEIHRAARRELYVQEAEVARGAYSSSGTQTE